MKNVFKLFLIAGAVLGLLGLCSGLALWHGLQEFVMQPDVSLSINGEAIDIDGLRNLSSAPWYELLFGMLTAGVVVCLILPMLLLFSIGLPILLTVMILGFVAFALLSLGGLLFSPFIIVALLLWLAFRNKRRPAQGMPHPAPRA